MLNTTPNRFLNLKNFKNGITFVKNASSITLINKTGETSQRGFYGLAGRGVTFLKVRGLHVLFYRYKEVIC